MNYNENNNIMWKFEISKRNDDSCRKNGIIKLKESHFRRIELSDAILVINVNNYIGDSTNIEIDYAKKLGKEIIYYTDLVKEN